MTVACETAHSVPEAPLGLVAHGATTRALRAAGALAVAARALQRSAFGGASLSHG